MALGLVLKLLAHFSSLGLTQEDTWPSYDADGSFWKASGHRGCDDDSPTGIGNVDRQKDGGQKNAGRKMFIADTSVSVATLVTSTRRTRAGPRIKTIIAGL